MTLASERETPPDSLQFESWLIDLDGLGDRSTKPTVLCPGEDLSRLGNI
jgi:hypothetical protein